MFVHVFLNACKMFAVIVFVCTLRLLNAAGSATVIGPVKTITTTANGVGITALAAKCVRGMLYGAKQRANPEHALLANPTPAFTGLLDSAARVRAGLAVGGDAALALFRGMTRNGAIEARRNMICLSNGLA